MVKHDRCQVLHIRDWNKILRVHHHQVSSIRRTCDGMIYVSSLAPLAEDPSSLALFGGGGPVDMPDQPET